jgi:hypothetical protein
MKQGLYLITIKHGSGQEESLHIPSNSMLNAVLSSYDYLDRTLTPGTSCDITKVEHVGKVVVVEPDYSLAP